MTEESLLKNPHVGLPNPEPETLRCSLVKGDYLFYHYGCDGHDDRGWGCGYRTLQTLSSWLCLNGPQQQNQKAAPSITDIQEYLIVLGDKPATFLGCREWIGTCEAAMILDHHHDVPCRILHVRAGGSEMEGVAEELHHHFRINGSPVMMGGDRDNSSKGILGVCTGVQGSYLLVLDPHYYGPSLDTGEVQRLGWVVWKRVDSLDHNSFYNLCLPQTARK
ncbi:ufm1-specific protease 1 [Scleropages formosus]|nr:inactive Ufm1-specific protease 1 [Scleropages formosus]